MRALGGNRNLKLVDACTTRLRLEVVDDALVNEPALRSFGARGIVRPGRNALQVVIGPQAEILAGEIREAMAGGQYEALALAAAAPAVVAEPGPRRSLISRLGRALKTPKSLSDSCALSADLPMSKRPSMWR